MPQILVSWAAARQIFAEIQRWVEVGLQQSGSALESLVYPLSALVPAGIIKCPVELVRLDELRALVLDGVAIPPDSVKAFSPANCHFAPDDPAAANQRFNDAIDALLERRPRLAVNSKLHSHPFSASPFLSGGDIFHGVHSPQARRWRGRRGLATALLHVVYPDGEPRVAASPWRLTAAGAVCAAGGQRVTWRIRSWGSLPGGAMEDLGDAALVPARHPLVRACRRLPYWLRRHGAAWCTRQKAALRALPGLRVSRNLLGRGWRRYLLHAGGQHLLLALPPDLPVAPPRVLRIHDAVADQFEVLDLPRRFDTRSLTSLSLPELARHYLGRP